MHVFLGGILFRPCFAFSIVVGAFYTVHYFPFQLLTPYMLLPTKKETGFVVPTKRYCLGCVDWVLCFLRELLARPVGIFVAHASLAAMKH